MRFNFRYNSFTVTHAQQTHTHSHVRLCLMFGEKLWKRQLWRDGERHAGLTLSNLWSTAKSQLWNSTGLTGTDGHGVLIRLVSTTITIILFTAYQLCTLLNLTKKYINSFHNVMPVLHFKQPKQELLACSQWVSQVFPVFLMAAEGTLRHCLL